MLYLYNDVDGFTMSAKMKEAFETAHKAGEDSFEFEGEKYILVKEGFEVAISKEQEVAIGSSLIYDAYNAENSSIVNSYGFRLEAERAMAEDKQSFSFDGANYLLEEGENVSTIYRLDGDTKQPFVNVSKMIVNAISPDVFLPVEFKNTVLNTVLNRENKFTYVHEDGEEIEYTLNLVHETYNVKRMTETHLIDMYHMPDEKHLLGTDMNGMDVLTRLMYGGRISLLVGFVVVFITMIIGVSVGGVAGYFGGWVDTLLMRFIDLFNSIPYWPIMIITGSVMDTMEVDPYTRVFLLMAIMGVMGWTGIARVVRGQILALREQDFMVAAEASGLSVKRRIIKHLIPNVMPLLIVQGTMSLGSIILTEATLSFLGLGVKFPIASWGSIINAASQPYIVNNYWFIWMPAGFLILLTVLGFNFMGDGLRDAYDPKMKR